MTTQTINQTTTNVSKPAPFVEGLGTAFAGRLAPMLDPNKAVDTSKFAPQVANQNALSQAALQQQATASGLGSLQFGADGTVSGIGPGTGLASYQPYLDAASQAGMGLSQAATAGQGAGNQAIQGAGLQAAALGMAGAAGQNVGAANLRAAAGLTGPGASSAFMSPYQQQVIDATQASYQNQRAQGRQSISDAAITAGAYGGGREGVQRGVYDAQTTLGAAQLEADLRAQNFAQAQNQANTAFGQQTDLAGLQQQQAAQNQALLQNSMSAQGQLAGLQQGQSTQNQALLQNALAGQSGLATLTPTLQQASTQQLQQLGTGQQALNQAQLDATAAGNREKAYEQQQRLGFFGQQFAPLMGGMGATQQYQTAQPAPSAMQTILGTGAGIGGLLGGLFGK